MFRSSYTSPYDFSWSTCYHEYNVPRRGEEDAVVYLASRLRKSFTRWIRGTAIGKKISSLGQRLSLKRRQSWIETDASAPDGSSAEPAAKRMRACSRESPLDVAPERHMEQDQGEQEILTEAEESQEAIEFDNFCRGPNAADEFQTEIHVLSEPNAVVEISVNIPLHRQTSTNDLLPNEDPSLDERIFCTPSEDPSLDERILCTPGEDPDKDATHASSDETAEVHAPALPNTDEDGSMVDGTSQQPDGGGSSRPSIEDPSSDEALDVASAAAAEEHLIVDAAEESCNFSSELSEENSTAAVTAGSVSSLSITGAFGEFDGQLLDNLDDEPNSSQRAAGDYDDVTFDSVIWSAKDGKPLEV